MTLIAYTLYDRSTGDVLRSGALAEEHLPQATAQHGLVRGLQVKRSLQRINPATLQPEPRPITHRQAWRDSLPSPEPTEIDVVLEALRTKGIDLKAGDLSAAAASLQARRRGPAQAGKQPL
jgi:hypothetical protein